MGATSRLKVTGPVGSWEGSGGLQAARRTSGRGRSDGAGGGWVRDFFQHGGIAFPLISLLPGWRGFQGGSRGCRVGTSVPLDPPTGRQESRRSYLASLSFRWSQIMEMRPSTPRIEETPKTQEPRPAWLKSQAPTRAPQTPEAGQRHVDGVVQHHLPGTGEVQGTRGPDDLVTAVGDALDPGCPPGRARPAGATRRNSRGR